MHDQSARRISGRTLAAVAAMSVRVLRIVVLKSAGNFTRDEQYDPSAEKFPARHTHCVREVRNLLRAGNFRTPARPAGVKNYKASRR
jgi:purine nucleoside permease